MNMHANEYNGAMMLETVLVDDKDDDGDEDKDGLEER